MLADNSDTCELLGDFTVGVYRLCDTVPIRRIAVNLNRYVRIATWCSSKPSGAVARGHIRMKAVYDAHVRRELQKLEAGEAVLYQHRADCSVV